jgi:carboxylate-amine ligase
MMPISSGTHPFGMASAQLISPSPRYHELIEAMQWPARRLLICGMHVHVGVVDGERAIAVINELTRHLPLFLALSASSPFFEGEDSGLASARSKVFEALPTAGLPPHISGWVDFEAFMSTLLDSGCISSIREVWWDIRPHPDFGTIEFRMCDATPTLTEATALTALAQALVVWCNRRIDDDDLPAPPRDWTVRENRWLAGRYGIEASLIVEDLELGTVHRRPVRDLVVELVEELRPIAEELGSVAELGDVLTILDGGSGTARQRRVIAGGGSLVDVVHHLAKELADDRPRA